MIRNFLSGIVFGGVIAGLGVAVISQIAPMPVPIGDVANSTMAPEPSVEASVDGLAVGEPAADAGVTPDAAVPQAEPEPKTETETETVAGTETEAGTDGPEVADATVVAPVTDPTAPGFTDTVETTIDAVQPDVLDQAPPTPELPVAGMPAPEVASVDDAAPMAAASIDKPAAPAAEMPQINADLPPAAPVEAQDTLLSPLSEPATPEPSAEMAMDLPAVDGAPAESDTLETGTSETAPEQPAVEPPLVADNAPAAPEASQTAELPVILPAPETPEALAPAPAVTKTADGVTTGRLPSIGKADPAPEAEAAAALDPTDPRPVAKFARAFTNDSGKPEFAIVLIDTGAADLDRAQLAAIGFPVTFAIDPLDPSASAAMAIYREGGQEVVMLASGIPLGANVSDLEQTFQANEQVLSETVAVMDIGAGGFQDDRVLAAQVVPLIKGQGRGLLTFDRGLNAADQVARREAVPSAVIFRELDAAGEATPIIRRYLDRAAFKAAQEGRVVVLGTTRPETIAALVEWAVEGRAASVTLAPLTAVLTKP